MTKFQSQRGHDDEATAATDHARSNFLFGDLELGHSLDIGI